MFVLSFRFIVSASTPGPVAFPPSALGGVVGGVVGGMLIICTAVIVFVIVVVKKRPPRDLPRLVSVVGSIKCRPFIELIATFSLFQCPEFCVYTLCCLWQLSIET